MSELQHPEARSFEQVADLYERTRPTYPPDAVDWLVERLQIESGSTVLDLGAGTGKLTRMLVSRVGHVVAVEPGPAMLGELVRAVPEAEPVLAAAESIPLADDSVDAVLCGQSFHWFRVDEALPEIRRVLRPERGLGLIWNLRDPDDGLQREVTELIDPFVPRGREPVGSVTDAIDADPRFGEIARYEAAFAEELDADALVDRIASISFVAAAPEAQQRDLFDSLRGAVAARGGTVAFRYRTEAYVTFAV